MTPRRVYIIDPETLKITGFAYEEPGPVPDAIIPPEPDEPKDGGLLKDKPGTLNNEKPN